MSTLESLSRRLKSRLALGLSLARANRFITELEPSQGNGPDPFAALAAAFRDWRQALREQDFDAAVDAVERTWAQLEACRSRLIAGDASIAAYRLRWACENAPLRHRTVDSLARFYRLLPFSRSSQSKYEYVLTRLLAGPIGPDRRQGPTEDLIRAVVGCENSWGANPVTVEDSEVTALTLALRSFAFEATRQDDAAAFTTSALMRRFGAFKASMGEALLDPRLSVAVVETNVEVLNLLNRLLAEAGGQPFKWTTATRQAPFASRPVKPPLDASPEPAVTLERNPHENAPFPPVSRHPEGHEVPAGSASASPLGRAPVREIASVPRGEADALAQRPGFARSPDRSGLRNDGEGQPPERSVFADWEGADRLRREGAPPAEGLAPAAEGKAEAVVPRPRPELETGQIDLSGLAFLKFRRKTGPLAPVPAEPVVETTVTQSRADDLPIPPLPARDDVRTGEVDLSGLELIGLRRRRRTGPLPPPEASVEAPHRHDGPIGDQTASNGVGDADNGEGEPPRAGPPGTHEAPEEEAGQQPSQRAFELGKVPENAAIIERYLAWPRSPEVWRLNLDVFLGTSDAGSPNVETFATERRRAFELILAADDLICLRESQEGPPSAEHKAKEKGVANAMLQLRQSLHRAAIQAPKDSRLLEPLLYVSDHLLWERLRLEASLRRNPKQKGAPAPPGSDREAEPTEPRASSPKSRRRILTWGVGIVAGLVALVGVLAVALPKLPVDGEVNVVNLNALPGVQLFDDGRAFRTTLFISASPTWALLGPDERRSIVRTLGAFAAERGFTTVSVIGPRGEPWATFKDEEVILDGDLDGARPPAR